MTAVAALVENGDVNDDDKQNSTDFLHHVCVCAAHFSFDYSNVFLITFVENW